MFVPQISITQNNASELIFRDVTPAYSPQYVGGYGGPNIDVEQVTKVVLTLDFGKGYTFQISGPYKQTDGSWTIGAYELPTKTPAPAQACSGCGNYDNPGFDEGVMEEFPSGCLTISYKVYTGSESSQDGLQLAGLIITKFILRIKEQDRLIAAVQKLTIPNEHGVYDGLKWPARRSEILGYVNISWMKLELMDNQSGCDCNCIAGSLKQIDAYLNSVMR